MPEQSTVEEKAAFSLNWKRWIVVGISAGASLALLLPLIYWAVIEYQDRSTKVTNFLMITIPDKHVNAYLRTQWKGGSLHYVLTLMPTSPQYLDSFDEEMRNAPAITSTLKLQDKDGFQLCEFPVEPFAAIYASDAKVLQLSSKGEQKRACSADKYRHAASWDLTINNS